MKKLYTLVLGALSLIGLAQVPADYYSGTEGLTKEELKSKLSSIISQGHIDNGYDGLWRGYYTTDVDNYYEKDGTLLDIYSEFPNGIDTYTYTIGAKQCGTYSGEGDCYNREHIVPQSLFNKESPMRNDIHFIVPVDGYVNGKRSNYPFGVVSTATWTSKNGSKLGKDASGSIVFEPIDEFKGDVARMIFYFATRYETQLSSFKTGGILGGSAYPGIDATQLEVLLKWHNADPVSQKEIDRNNYAYQFQGNRNPYIDNPDWINAVWGESTSTEEIPVEPTPENPPVAGEHCGLIEDFETMPSVQGYKEVVWENNGITWTATDSRTDQTVNGKAITIRKGSLKSSAVSGGIGKLTLTTQRKYAGSESGELVLLINGEEKGKIPYGTDVITTEIEVNVAGNATIEIVNTHSKDRIAIDDLSWTCYEDKDTEAPTIPTNVVITETTTESISLEWAASTDNVGVVSYDVFVDGVLTATVSEPTATIVGLTPDTEYSFTIVARDEAGNESIPSEAVVGKTNPVVADIPATGEHCGLIEDFETMPSVQGYKEVVWENNGITWTATDSRTDQTVNGKAITIRKGSLKSSAVLGGIGKLTLTTQRKYAGSESGELVLLINGEEKGKIPYGTDVITTEIEANVAGNATIEIVNTHDKDRIAIDDLSWTCYSNGEEITPIEELPIEDKDTEAPTIPANVVITETTTESISLEWTASTDNVGVVSYDVFVDGVLTATVSEPIATIVGLTPDTEYSFTIVARDEAGNESIPSEAVVGKTLAIVVEKPVVETPRYTLPNLVERGKIVVYPNPVRSYGEFGIYGLEKGKVYTAEIYNSAGRLITKVESLVGDDAKISINQALAPDVYILRINGKGIKFIVE